MAENLHPMRLQPQFRQCYHLRPKPEKLFNLLQTFISKGDEPLPDFPTGFYAMDIFHLPLDQIVHLPSAEDGKIYVFTTLKFLKNGLQDCKTADGSWMKQQLISDEGGKSLQLATFYNKSKERSAWSKFLYSFHGQKTALCVIYKTKPKRKRGGSEKEGTAADTGVGSSAGLIKPATVVEQVDPLDDVVNSMMDSDTEIASQKLEEKIEEFRALLTGDNGSE